MKINREHIVGLICIAIAIAVLLITPGFPKGQEGVNLTGPAFFPDVLAIAYLVLGSLQLLAGFKKKNSNNIPEIRREAQAKKRSLWSIIEFIGLLLAFIVFFEPLGFFISTLVFLFLLMMLLGLNFGKCLLFSIFYTAVIYLLFGKLFTIGLPAGVLSFLGI